MDEHNNPSLNNHQCLHVGEMHVEQAMQIALDVSSRRCSFHVQIAQEGCQCPRLHAHNVELDK
eukprot:scaffold660124_cov57-Prasinocladus_malaysianus.AAC.1